MLIVEHKVFNSILQLFERTEADFEESVLAIRKWLSNQPHLPEVMDEARIRNFLLMNKCSIERTKEKIDNYYTFRQPYKEFFVSVNEESVKIGLENLYYTPLPKLTKNMCRVYVLKLRNPERQLDVDPYSTVARLIYALEIQLKEDHMYKIVLIVDAKDFTWSYLLKVTPTLASKTVRLYEKVYSNRLEAMYVINSFPGVQELLNLIKRFMKPKIFQRIHVSSDSKILNEVFQKEMIPKDYGGEEKSLEELHGLWNQKLNEYKNWFDKLNAMRVSEDLRPEKLTDDEFLGIYGNFKQLSVD